MISKEKIEEAMRIRKIKNKTLAELVGVSPSMITRYLNGESEMSATILCKIAAELRVSVDYLCGLESSGSLSTVGLTGEQKALLENVLEQFRKNNRPAKKMTEEQCALIGRIVEEFIK